MLGRMKGATVGTERLTEQVAEEIRAWLGRRRMSQAQLARSLGVSQMWVSDRLRGQQEIGLTDVERIAGVLGVRVVDLFPRAVLDADALVPNARSSPAPDRMTLCAPDVRSSPVRGMRRRPKLRDSNILPITV